MKLETKLKYITQKLIDHEYKSLILLIVFLIYFSCEPFVIKTSYEHVYINFYALFLIYSTYIITSNKKLFTFSAILGFSAVILKALYPDKISTPLLIVYGSILIFFNFSMTLSLIIYTSITSKLRKDLIFGIIFTYFMIGRGFGDLYYILYKFDLVHFKTAANAKMNLAMCDYYSFTTLTTLGYGDIVPAINCPLTMRLSSLEVCLGVMYTALFVGRLLNIYNQKK